MKELSYADMINSFSDDEKRIVINMAKESAQALDARLRTVQKIDWLKERHINIALLNKD